MSCYDLIIIPTEMIYNHLFRKVTIKLNLLFLWMHSALMLATESTNNGMYKKQVQVIPPFYYWKYENNAQWSLNRFTRISEEYGYIFLNPLFICIGVVSHFTSYQDIFSNLTGSWSWSWQWHFLLMVPFGSADHKVG